MLTGQHREREKLYDQLTEYYKRNLSFAEDTIRAVIGVINAFQMKTDSTVTHATHFYGLPILIGSGSFPTASSSFADSLSWWIPDQRTAETCGHAFPSWTWASVKANPHPDPSRDMWFCMTQVIKHQDMIQFWLYRRGEPEAETEKVELEHYVNNAQLRGKYLEFMPRVCMRSWMAVCTLPVDTNNISHIEELECEHLWVKMDYMGSQSAGEVLLAYLGRKYFKGMPKASVFLILTRAAKSLWKRIGLLEAGIKPSSGDQGLEHFLHTLKPSGGWELREVDII